MEEQRVSYEATPIKRQNPLEVLISQLNRSFELIILPTEQCDFRCRYCNQEFKLKMMTPEIVNATKILLSKRIPELEHLSIQWFGGEPLLAYGAIKDIMRHVKEVSGLQNQKMKLVSSMTTNASHLTSDKLLELSDLGVSGYQITLDGDKGAHNKLRITAGGKGTFDVIWKNVMAAHASTAGFDAMLRLHVNGENIESMKKFIDKIADNLHGDKRFALFIRNLSKFGGKYDDTLRFCADSTAVNELKRYAISKDLRLVAIDIYKHEGGHNICYAAKPNSLIIRADGRIAKCTAHLYDDYNSIGRINLDGTLSIDPEMHERWIGGFVNGDLSNLSCPRIGIENEMKLLRRSDTVQITVPQRVKARV